MSALAVAAAGAVMAGAALQSSIGFGFALVAAPLLYVAAPSPEQAVGLMILLGLEVNLLTLVAERRRPHPSWADAAGVVAWSLPGAIAGVAVLRALDALALQLLVTAGRAGRPGGQPARPAARVRRGARLVGAAGRRRRRRARSTRRPARAARRSSCC